MTIFGILWLIVVFLCFFNKNIKYMAFITLLFMTFQCANIICIADLSVGPQILTSVVFIIRVLVELKFKVIFSSRSFLENILWVAFVSTVVFTSIINRVFSSSFLYILQLFIYILSFKSFCAIKKNLPFDFIYNSIKKIIVFLLVVGVLQVLTTMDILPLRDVLKVLFYNDNSINVYFNSSVRYSRIMSTFMEPSYYAGLLVGAFYYFLSFQSLWKKNLWLLISLFVVILLTFSSTAYGAFFVVGCAFILLKKDLKIQWKILGVTIAALGFFVMMILFYDLLDVVIFSKFDTGSARTRSKWNESAWFLFLESPIWGVGYKNARGSSIVYSILAQLGIVGSGIYAMILFRYFAPVFKINKKKLRQMAALVRTHEIGARLALFSVFVCSIIAVPDLDLCTFWFWMYVFGMTINNKVQHAGELLC